MQGTLVFFGSCRYDNCFFFLAYTARLTQLCWLKYFWTSES